MKEVKYYYDKNGKCPYEEWFNSLSISFQVRVSKRINKLADGNYGDFKKLQNSELSELRLNFGKGYRIYYKDIDNVIILILAGSDKKEQKSVIKKANEYYADFKKRKEYLI